MKNIFQNIFGLLLCWLGLISSAHCHISYGGRDFGTLDPTIPRVVEISSQTVSSDFGWASGTDANLGDSHKLKAFKFYMAKAGTVQIRVEGLSFMKGSVSINALLRPAFSVYQGLAHESPAALDHDASAISTLYNDTTYGAGNWQGSFRALNDWKIGSDDGLTFADLSSFVYTGHGADGSAANYGGASGIYGDGKADGMVVRTLSLNPGFYSIFIGGAQYYDLSNSRGDASGSYGFSATLTVPAGKGSQTISFDPLPSKKFGDSPFDLTATASSNLDVTYSSSDTSVATILGKTVTILKGGSTVITAHQTGNEDYNAAPEVCQTLSVAPAGTTYFSWLNGVAPSDAYFWDYVYGAVAPGALDPSLRPTVSLEGGYLVLTYYLREGVAGLNVKVKTCSDLALSSNDWSDIDAKDIVKAGDIEAPTPTQASVQKWKASLSTSGDTQQFMRLEATETP